jgi:hypothetical protein
VQVGGAHFEANQVSMKREASGSESSVLLEVFEILPEPLREFLRAGKKEFRTERDDWIVDVEIPPGYLQKSLPAGSALIANNGVGDHLFLVPDPTNHAVLAHMVRVFWHERHRFEVIAEAISSLTNPPAPTVTKRPPVLYHDRIITVKLGDEVTARNFFLRRPGRVVYVPGISKKNRDMEFNGLCWVNIRFASGSRIGTLVDPKTSRLQKSVRFVRRSTGQIELMGPEERME